MKREIGRSGLRPTDLSINSYPAHHPDRTISRHEVFAMNGAPPITLIRHDLTHFDHSLFSRYNIDCPPRISASVEKRQVEYFFGRLAAQVALSAIGHDTVTLATGPHGEPLWPQGIIGSITHTCEFAAAIALPCLQYIGIGIDIESVADPDTLQALLAKVISPPEHAYLKSLGRSAPLEVLAAIAFSAKESFYKAVFSHAQCSFDLTAACITDLDSDARRLTLTLDKKLSPQFPRYSSWRVYFDFISTQAILTYCALPSSSRSMATQHMPQANGTNDALVGFALPASRGR
jgi:4'-phosphopantetheinyl transferase EntD